VQEQRFKAGVTLVCVILGALCIAISFWMNDAYSQRRYLVPGIVLLVFGVVILMSGRRGRE
jgi:hypothetical protein